MFFVTLRAFVIKRTGKSPRWAALCFSGETVSEPEDVCPAGAESALPVDVGLFPWPAIPLLSSVMAGTSPVDWPAFSSS